MSTLKVFFLAICFLLPLKTIYAGEPGTEDDIQVQKKRADKSEQTMQKKETIKQKLVDTDIQLPKNPIDKIFLQPLGGVLDPRYVTIIGECSPAQKGYGCKIVRPKKNSDHFNKYHYYLNANQQVYGVIAFRDYRIGNVDYCRSLIGQWGEYFNNFEFETKTKEENLDQLVLITKSIKPSEVYMSCYPESYRDIQSYFSLKLFIHET